MVVSSKIYTSLLMRNIAQINQKFTDRKTRISLSVFLRKKGLKVYRTPFNLYVS